MNKYLLAAGIENLKYLHEACSQGHLSERAQILLKDLGSLIPMEQPTETPENERDLGDRDASLFLWGKISSFLNNLLFFLEPLANSHFALAQKIMVYRFEDLRTDYPEDKYRWYEIAWILLWEVHQLQTKVAPDLRNMERIQ